MDSTSLLPASQQLLGSWLLASLEGEEMKTASQTGDSDSLLLVDNFWEEIGFPTPASRWWDRNSSDSHSLVGTTISTQKTSPGQTLVRGNGGSTRRWLGNVVRKQQFQRPHLPRFGGNNAGKEGLLKGSTTLSASSIREPIPGRLAFVIMETSRGLPSKLDRYNHPQRRCRQTKNNRGRYQRSK